MYRRYDCVSFYHYLETLRTSKDAFNLDSHWLLLDATDDLYAAARGRVFKPEPKQAKAAKTAPGAAAGAAARKPPPPPEVRFERNPKWDALVQLLDEVDARHRRQLDTLGRTLVCVTDGKTARQLSVVLSEGADALMQRQLKVYQRWRGDVTMLSGQDGILHPTSSTGTGGGQLSRRQQRVAARSKRRRADPTIDVAATLAEDAVDGSQMAAEDGGGFSIQDTPDEVGACGTVVAVCTHARTLNHTGANGVQRLALWCVQFTLVRRLTITFAYHFSITGLCKELPSPRPLDGGDSSCSAGRS